ncbi:MAG: alpha/beta fold hydrolase [Gemmatimonas sp.]|uniref:alpha/beta hydrolase n=1 Tax=Gemmatimonas sp. TaxID=1962908 RepID=UPI0022C8F413|nr:alpha/beta fold hydrolase [Gemmatimonas sp.]MCZ8012053.1 alpha/beta fold hydrolase [Gemmatimonas sp.]MCZ8267373.1 alpha/beta fold hydrolase [Gemmatimonas sp.]
MNAAGRRSGWRPLLVVTAVLAAAGGAIGVMLQRGTPVRVLTRPGIGSAPASTQGGERMFVTRDSINLSARQLVMRSRGSVVIVHGLGEGDSLFARWNEALAASTQMNVIGLSLRGNGRSRGTEARDDPPEAYALDLAAAVQELKRRQPSGPVLFAVAYGGAGITAHYERVRAARELPAVDGIMVFDVAADANARVPNGRPVTLYPQRLASLALLGKTGAPWFGHLEVAMQSGDGRELTTRWTHGHWHLASPALEPLLATHGTSRTPLLVLSPRERPAATAEAAQPTEVEWVRVVGTADPTLPTVQAAVSRWSAAYAADAFDPMPPRPTQTLDVLGRH